ncbi:ferredoxin [Actinoallomurus sp. CA-150999]|uniref:ferredoxin n=1 Tax=Actinoallomurus sp. CA-150999 TaxID=3239887 RepID=UPI003D8B6A40
MELRIDRIACDGAGLCAEILPELVTLDEWGYPIIEDARVGPGRQANARRAVSLCPRLALRLAESRQRTPPSSRAA